MLKPVIIDNVFTTEEVARLRELMLEEPSRKKEYDPFCKRLMIYTDELEKVFSKKLEPLAAKYSGDPTMKTSYSALIQYAWENSKLPPHTDQSASTFSIDYMLTQKTEPWPVVVDGVPYYLKENQALCFLGSELVHYRDPMPDPDNNLVEIGLFHFEPADSWYFGNCCPDFKLDVER